jgi:glycosyltransferase involved in cell wall biosynthesis
LIYPSQYMQRRHRALFSDRQPEQREIVIAPATSRPPAPPAKGGDRPNVAFIGGAEIAAGPFLIPPIMDEIRKERPKTSGFVYGTGDSEMLKRVSKAKRVTIRGYYRKGSLPSLLASDRIGVAILPAIWPDAYGLVVDDCLSAGVPVVALEFGAVADRLSYWEVGSVVPLAEGMEGLAQAAADLLDSQARVPQSIIKTLPAIDRAAQRHIEMYKFMRIRAQKNKR